jgi:hypothetical protein
VPRRKKKCIFITGKKQALTRYYNDTKKNEIKDNQSIQMS